MADDRPVLNQINLVVRDMDAMIEFYRKLEADTRQRILRRIGITAPFRCRWTRLRPRQHGLAAQWNRGWPPGQTGPVVGFRVASQEAVDQIYKGLANAGYVEPATAV